MDRYPLLFKESSNYFIKKHITQPKILSFGCSTGEEVLSIKNYLPHSIVHGTDINKKCIEHCQRNIVDTDLFFYNRLSNEFNIESNFDAIFCLAVFQRTENRTKKSRKKATGFVFNDFENELIELNKKLNIGGLLIIDHCDFNFADIKIS